MSGMQHFAEPALHSYLGNISSGHQSRLVLHEGRILDVPVIKLSGVVLFPGESLPLRITDPSFIFYFSDHQSVEDLSTPGIGLLPDDKSLIAISCLFEEDSDRNVVHNIYGTMAEIVSIVFSADEIKLVARGRCRYSIISSKRIQGLQWGRVSIIDERVPLPLPLPCFDENWGRSFPQWVSSLSIVMIYLCWSTMF
jgi:cereblon